MNRSTLTCAALAGFVAAACGGDAGTSVPDNTSDAVANYAAIVRAGYADSLAAARELDAAIAAFVAAPSESGLSAARQAWLDSREPYLQTEVFRFYDGPIDNPVDGPEGLINAWPLDEAYIDYVVGDDSAGIINDTGITIDATTLEGMNEQGGEANVATGYHAIEFLLWGQDLSDDGPGARPYTDYLTAGGTAAHQGRRGQYLTTVSTMLVGHLQALTDAWAEDASYRTEMVAGDPADGLRRILTGLIVLSGFETGGERLQTALDSGDQEDEHSCFSDNTHRDMVQDIRGMHNVWRGSYGAITGAGVRDVVLAVDAELAAMVDARLDTSLALAEALQPPFDQEIAAGNREGRARVQALVVSLQQQEALFEDVFRLFELDVPVVE